MQKWVGEQRTTMILFGGCLKELAAMICLTAIFSIGLSLSGNTVAQSTKPPEPMQDWVNPIAPGIRVVGHANLSAVHFTMNIYAWTKDGKFLVGSRGRRLVVLDWDAQVVVREIAMPMRNGSDGISAMFYTDDGEHFVVIVRWSGRPYDPNDGTDLDDEDWAQQFQEFSPFKFRGQRMLVYDRHWNLKHDLELADPVAKDFVPTIGQNQELNTFILLPNGQELVAVGGPHAKLVDIKNGKVLAQRTGISDGVLVSPHELVYGHPLKTWDILANTVRDGMPFDLPPSSRPSLIDSSSTKILYRNRTKQELVLWDRTTNRHQVISNAQHTGSGSFSSDGRLLVFNEISADNGSTRINVYDTASETFKYRVDIDGHLGRYHFRAAHHSLMVQGWNECSLVEVPIDAKFPETIARLVNRLPNAGRINFTDGNRKLVFGTGNCWLDTRDLTTMGKCYADRGTLSLTKPQQVQILEEWSGGSSNGDHEVGISDLTGESFRKLYSLTPVRALAQLQTLLGVPQQRRPGIQSYCLEFDPSGETVRDLYAEGGDVLRLRVSRTDSGKRLSEDRLHTQLKLTPQGRGTISPDGRRVAIAEQNKLEVLDTESGKLLQEWTTSLPVARVSLDRRGEYVAVALANKSWYTIRQLKVFRVSDGQEVCSEVDREFVSFGFQPGLDRFYLLTAGKENQLRIWDRESWSIAWENTTSHAPAYDMAMSSDGSQIAIGLRDSRVELWELSEIRQ